jgi:hypothetical protein
VKTLKLILKYAQKAITSIYSFFTESKANIVVLLLLVIIFIVAFKLEIHNNKASGFLDSDFWLDNLLPNIIADIIGIVFTSFIIAGLFARHQRKSEDKRLYDIMGIDYDSLVHKLICNFLYFLTRDEKIMGSFRNPENLIKLKSIIKDRDSSVEFSKLNSNFKVWDINQGSTIVDSFVNHISKIEEHEKLAWYILEEYEKLKMRKKKLELELKQLDEDSIRYKKNMIYYQQIKDKMDTNLRLDTTISEDDLIVKIKEVIRGFIVFIDVKSQEFYSKYTFIVPLDIRLSIIEIDKNLKSISTHLYHYNQRFPWRENLKDYKSIDEYRESLQEYRDNLKEKTLDDIESIAEELLKLANYFKKVK